MTDRRTERIANYTRHEHANSYAVETAGLKELVFGKKNKKYGKTTEEKVVDLQELNLALLHRVKKLETTIMAEERTWKAMEKVTDKIIDKVADHQEQLMYLHDRARKEAIKLDELTKTMRQITQLLVGIQAWQKQTQDHIADLQKVLLRIPGLRAKN